LLLLLLCVPSVGFATDAAVSAFKKAWKAAGQDVDAQKGALRGLAQGGTPDCAGLLARYAVSQELNFEVRDTAEQALFAMKDPEVGLWASKGLEGAEKDPAQRVLLCRYLSARAALDPAVGMLLLPALQDKQERVRVAAVEGLSNVRRKVVVSALVRCLAGASGRLEGDCDRALQRLTGKTLPAPGDWIAWWKGNQEGFSFPSSEDEEDDAPAADGGDDVPEDGKRFKTVTRLEPPGKLGKTIYEKVDSKRVVFVVDFSGSMQIRCQDSTGRSRSRLDYVRTELSTVITELDEDARFNIIGFSTEVRPWKKKLVKATDKNKKRARSWVRKTLRPDGETNIYGALETAFRHKDVDTIYFLTDGTPTAGEVTINSEILGKVRQWNASRGVRVHAIGFLAGEGHGLIIENKGMSKRFLKKLAKGNGGSFRAFE
jgi:hypothetical protein